MARTLYEEIQRSMFVVPTARIDENDVTSAISLPPLSNIHSRSVALKETSETVPQQLCVPNPVAALCDANTTQQCSTVISPDCLMAPHDSTLFAPARTMATASSSVLDMPMVAPSEQLLASSSVKQQMTISPCNIFCEHNIDTKSSSQMQQPFNTPSPDSLSFLSSNLSDSNLSSSSSLSSPYSSSPQNISVSDTNHLPSSASLHLPQQYYIENPPPFDFPVTVEQIAHNGLIISNEFLDGLIEETREEIRREENRIFLKKRPEPNSFNHLPTKRHCTSPENYDILDPEAHCTEQIDVANQFMCNVDLTTNEQNVCIFDGTTNSRDCLRLDAIAVFGSEGAESTESLIVTESSCCSTSPDSSPSYPRHRASPLASLSAEEIAERKREQNRTAAARYRKKLKTSQEMDRLEIDRLEKRNTFLKANVEVLMEEISSYKQMILDAIRNEKNGNGK